MNLLTLCSPFFDFTLSVVYGLLFHDGALVEAQAGNTEWLIAMRTFLQVLIAHASAAIGALADRISTAWMP
jgi:hypothetical protein